MAQAGAGSGGGGDYDIFVRIGAQITGFTSKVGEVSQLVNGLLGRFVALKGAVEGGQMFKRFIDETSQIILESKRLSQQLGMEVKDASVLATALDDVGSSTDAYSAAFTKFNRQLRSNSEEMARMGVDVEAVRRGTKSSNEVFLESIKLLDRYAPGIDRTQAAMRLFGTRAGDMNKLLKLTPEVMEEARKKNEELNLSVTAGSLLMQENYRKAVNDVNDVWKGTVKTIGETVMPIFTRLSNEFASWGPAIVEVTKTVMSAIADMWEEVTKTFKALWSVIATVIGGLNGLSTAMSGTSAVGLVLWATLSALQMLFVGLRVSVELAANAFRTLMNIFEIGMSRLMSAFDKLKSGDFAGAWKELGVGWDDVGDEWEAGIDRAVKIAEKGQEDLADAMKTPAQKKAEEEANYGNEGRNAPPAPAKLKMPFDEASAERMRKAEQARERAIIESNLAFEREMIREAQAALEDSYSNRYISIEDYFEQKRALELRDVDVQRQSKEETLRSLEADYKKEKTAAGRVQIQAQMVRTAGEIRVLDAQELEISRNIERSKENALRIEQQRVALVQAQTAESSVTSEIERERTIAQNRVANFQMTLEQMLTMERDWENRRFAARMKTLEVQGAQLRESDLAAIAAHNKEVQEELQRHANAVIDINAKIFTEFQRQQLRALTDMRRNFQDFFESILSGNVKVSTAFHRLFREIADAMRRLIAEKLMEKLLGPDTLIMKTMNRVVDVVWNTVWEVIAATKFGEMMKTMLTEAGIIARTAAETSAIVTKKAEAAAIIPAEAAIAAGGAAAAMASIPYVGPALAAAAYAETMALVMSGLAVAAAEGGWWNIPQDQLALVHKNEMVLPAREAEILRTTVAMSDTESRLPMSAPAEQTMPETLAAPPPAGIVVSDVSQRLSDVASMVDTTRSQMSEMLSTEQARTESIRSAVDAERAAASSRTTDITDARTTDITDASRATERTSDAVRTAEATRAAETASETAIASEVARAVEASRTSEVTAESARASARTAESERDTGTDSRVAAVESRVASASADSASTRSDFEAQAIRTQADMRTVAERVSSTHAAAEEQTTRMRAEMQSTVDRVLGAQMVVDARTRSAQADTQSSVERLTSEHASTSDEVQRSRSDTQAAVERVSTAHADTTSSVASAREEMRSDAVRMDRRIDGLRINSYLLRANVDTAMERATSESEASRTYAQTAVERSQRTSADAAARSDRAFEQVRVADYLTRSWVQDRIARISDEPSAAEEPEGVRVERQVAGLRQIEPPPTMPTATRISTAADGGRPQLIGAGAKGVGMRGIAMPAGALGSPVSGMWQLPGQQLAQAQAAGTGSGPLGTAELRDMVESRSAPPVNLTVNAVDAKSVERLFRDNGQTLVNVLKQQRRNFAF